MWFTRKYKLATFNWELKYYKIEFNSGKIFVGGSINKINVGSSGGSTEIGLRFFLWSELLLVAPQ